MAFKIRGNSQIRNTSIGLDKLQDLDSGKILGRSLNSESGSLSQLSGNSVSIISGLGTTDNVEFSEITGTSGNFTSTLNADGNVTFGNNLTVDGNLIITNGSSTILEIDNLSIEDPMMSLSKGNTSTTLSKIETLGASDGASGDAFGYGSAISRDGEVLVVGSPYWEGSTQDQGGVYVYDWSSSLNKWVQRSSGDNIVTNHDLSSGDLTGWTDLSVSATVDYFEYNGKGSIRLIPANSYSTEGTWASVSQNVNYNFESGKTYKLKFDVLHYTNADRNIVYGIAEVDSNGDFSAWRTGYNLDVDDAVPGESTSGEISMEWTANDNTTSVVQIRINHGGDPLNQSGAVYVTNFRITDEYDMVITDGDSVLTASDAGNQDRFGSTCSINGDGSIIAIGSPQWDGNYFDQGTVYVYEYVSGSWTQKGSVLVPNDIGSQDLHFTVGLNSDGTILAVGSMAWDGSGGSNQGAVYVYDWNESTEDWDQRSRITASDAASGDAFGYDISLSSDGTIMAIGARDWEGTYSGQGGVYIYDWSDTDNDGTADSWVQRGDVIVSNSEGSGTIGFGLSVELNGDGTVLAVGQIGAGWSTHTNKHIEIFDWNSSTEVWDYRTKIDAESDSTRTASQSGFGISLSMNSSGSKIVVGATNDNSGKGYVYIYENDNSNSVDIGFFGTHQSYSSTQQLIENGTFDSDLSGWTDISSNDIGSYEWSAEYSSSYDNSLKLTTSFGGSHEGTKSAMVYQSLEFSPDTSGDKSYKFKVDLKNKSSMHSSTLLKLSIWDSSDTPVVGDSGSVSTVQFSDSQLSSGSTYSSGTITPSTNQYNTGFIVSIALQNDVNYTISPGAGSVWLDNVKLYEVDIATGNETEYTAAFTQYSGIFRDASDGKFKLFKTTQDISTSTTVNTSHINYSKSTLVSDIEGNINFSTNRTFSLSGDVVGSATFSGNNSPEITTTIQDNSVQLSNIDFFVNENDMSSNSDVKIPSQQSVKSYIDSQISGGGFSDLEVGDIKMVSETSTGVYEFVKVKNNIEHKTVSSGDSNNNYLTLSTPVESEFERLSKIYLNGQKLRYSSDNGTNNDYWFSETGPSATLYSTTLTASDGESSDTYTTQGISMSDDGNILAVVSRDWDRPGGGSNHGGVYIYDWNSTNEEWDQRGDVFSPPSDATSGILWGHSVSLSSDGSYMAVGSVYYTDTATHQGGVFVYKWNSSTNSWDSHGSVVVASDAGYGDRHIMPSLSGDASVLAVGAFSWDGSGKTNDGKVYIYDWDSTNEEWDIRSTINASDAASYDYFGMDVSLSSDASILAVGSGRWEGGTTDQGGVYIYDWTDTDEDGTADSWVQRGDVIESNNPSVSAYFGHGVELNNAGTTLIVGSNGAGKAEIFDWNSSTSSWDFRTSVSDPVSGGINFGGSVAISSDASKFVVGSFGNGSTIAGRAHTYSLSNTSTRNKVNFNSGTISENDKLEIRYYIKS